MSEDMPLHMWEWYNNKYTSKAAVLENAYPNLLAVNFELQIALLQIKMAEAFIDKFMEAAQE